MAGAYIALTLYQASGSYFASAMGEGAAIAVGVLGILFERLLMSKVYGSNVLDAAFGLLRRDPDLR